MDLVKLSQLLKPNEFSSPDLNIFGNAITMLAEAISIQLPAASGMCQGVIDQLRGEYNKQKDAFYSIERYFTGNGPVATKLKEHIHLMDFITRTRTLPEYSNKNITILFINKDLQEAMDAFNFNPIKSYEQWKSLRDKLNGLHQKTIQYQFTASKPKSMFMVDIENMVSGIYTNESRDSVLTIVLKIKPYDDSDFQVCFVSRKNRASDYNAENDLWYYHPGEDQWILDNPQFRKDIVFASVEEKLMLEYERVIAEAKPLSNDFDVVNEIDQSDMDVHALLINLELITNNVHLNDNEATETTYSQHGSNYSVIHQHPDEIVMTINTHYFSVRYMRPKDPTTTIQREIRSRTPEGMVGVADFTETPKHQLIELIFRVRRTIMQFNRYIEDKKRKQLKT